VASYYDRLNAGKTGWKSSEDGRGGIVTMDHIGNGVPKSQVQGAHQKKKRARTMKSDLKALSSQFFAEYAKSKKAVD
jgi:hypothetical protein